MTEMFHRLHHVCLVVHDIDRAQAYYESLGIGPWIAYPPLADYTDLSVPDRDGFLDLRYRVCTVGPVQLQLCQPGHDATPQRAFLDSKGEGVYHLGFEVADADAAEAEGLAAGLSFLARGRRDTGTGFDYWDTADQAGVVLLTRSTPPAP